MLGRQDIIALKKKNSYSGQWGRNTTSTPQGVQSPEPVLWRADKIDWKEDMPSFLINLVMNVNYVLLPHPFSDLYFQALPI